LQIIRVTNTLPSNSPLSVDPLTLSVKKLTLAEEIAPLDLFTPMADEPWAMWLDSGQSQHIDACFDILVWQPEVTLCTYGDDTHVHHRKINKTISSKEDPLSVLENIQKQTLTTLMDSAENLPFLGGALGYFSYDLGRRFEKLPTQAQQDINLPEMAVGIYAQAIVFDHKRKQYFLICQEDKRLAIEAFLRTKLNEKQSQQNLKDNFALTSPWQSNMNQASYIEKFKKVQQFLSSGDCYQINLSQRFETNYQGDEFQAYMALRSENKAPFSAFIRLDNSAILSVSPERFLKLSAGKVQSKPIKGTMPRSADKAQDELNAQQLANSIKDRAENVMIVDLLRNDISKVCQANTVVVPKLFDIESFPSVHHLVSTVEGQLSDQFNACDLMRGAFPGGSITGAPKIRAMEIIEQLEPHRRSVYCGSIGYISNCGTMDTSITIRTLICDRAKQTKNQGKMYCSAGGGLVADSIAESEYQETFDKVNRILPILEQFSAINDSE
jgi:para-aminobenzoate synthetase component 1